MELPLLTQIEWYGGYLLFIAACGGIAVLYDWRFPPQRGGGSWGFGHSPDFWLPTGPKGTDWKKFHEELDEIGKNVKIEEEEIAASVK